MYSRTCERWSGPSRFCADAGPTPSATAPARRRTVKRWEGAPCDRADGSGRSIMSRRGTDWVEIGEAEGRRNSCRERSSGPTEMRREVRLYSKWNIHSRNSRFDEGRSPIPRPEPSHRAGPHPPLPAPMGGRQPGEGPACGLCRRHAGMPEGQLWARSSSHGRDRAQFRRFRIDVSGFAHCVRPARRDTGLRETRRIGTLWARCSCVRLPSL